MPFAVSGHSLVITSQQALNNSMAPVGNWTGSLLNFVVDFLPVIIGIAVIFLILRFIFRKLS